MKRAEGMGRIVLVLTLVTLAATFAWAESKKASSKNAAATGKKNTDAGKSKADKAKDDAQDDDALFEKKEGDQDAAEVEINPDLSDFYAEVAQVTQLDEKGQEKLLAVQEKKKKALQKYDKKNESNIVRIENEMDRTDNEKRREKLRFELKKIEVNREKLQEQADNFALRGLSKDQMITWNAYELWAVVSPELEFEGDLEMTDKQVDKAQAVCKQLAEKMGVKNRMAKNPSAVKMAIGQIGRQVLDKKQRDAYVRQQRRKQVMENGDVHKGGVEVRRGRGH
jgi:hypothetical protein